MSMLRPMRDDLFKYRKRKKVSLDGSVPGVSYDRLKRSRRYVSGTPYSSGRSYNHPDLYLPDNPRGYRPDFNAPAAQSEDYEANNDWDSHRISHPTDPRLFCPSHELPVEQESISYENAKTASDFFLKAMETMYQQFEEGQKIPSLADIWQKHCESYGDVISDIEKSVEAAELTPEAIAGRLRDITDALNRLQCVLPEDHPDIVNLRQAQIQLGRQQLFEMEQDPKFWEIYNSIDDSWQSRLGEGNPYENDDIIPFEQPDNTARNIFRLPDLSLLQRDMPVMFDEVEPATMHNEQDVMQAEDYSGVQNLEQIVENEPVLETQSQFAQNDMMQMMEVTAPEMADPVAQDSGYDHSTAAFDEINQAIDQVIEGPTPQEVEPDPFQQLYDPLMAQQYMFNPQYRPDYMAGGPMPPGPDMGFGPMGPGPMPGP